MQCRRPGFHPWIGKIPWRRERLSTPVFWPREYHGQSMGLQRVGQDWTTFTFTFIYYMEFIIRVYQCFLGLWHTGEENGNNSLQYSCLENSMDRRAWQATVHGVADLDLTERPCTYTHTYISFILGFFLLTAWFNLVNSYSLLFFINLLPEYILKWLSPKEF